MILVIKPEEKNFIESMNKNIYANKKVITRLSIWGGVFFQRLEVLKFILFIIPLVFDL